MTQHDIADQNVERLLGVAYKPEPIDPAFLLETEEKLLAAAEHAAEAPAPAPADSAKLLRIRRRLSWAMAAAAAVAVCAISWYVSRPAAPRHDSPIADLPRSKTDFASLKPYFLTAQPRPESAKPEPLEVGGALATAHGERRRVVLADGSILFVNENTKLNYTAARQLRLDQGDVYLEVAPKDAAERFVVSTPQRQFTATGTHFHVAATPKGSGVLVTQGKVKVSDVPAEVGAGQHVAPGAKQAAVAPRASAILDWLKPLVAAADAALVPAGKHDGGCLIALDPNGQEINLSMRKYHIDVHIEDGFARTTIDQTYFNNTWNRLEGTFYFPLPPDASLSRLAMYVLDGKDCKLMEGGMAERDHARNVYEKIRYERRDPALLEWVDGSTFKMRVFPLEAWQEKRIILSYTQRLPSLYGVTKYRFPGGHNMQIVRDWSFEAHIKNAKQSEVLTPSHPDMKRTGDGSDTLTLQTGAKVIKPEQDVVLELREREAPPDGATFATHLQDGQRYFMVRYRPKLDAKPERQRRDWIVLFESSANRDPLLARTQIDAFRNLLKNVEYDDTFTVLTVNTRVQAFNAKPQTATPANVKAAVEFLEKTHLVGGCDLEQALRKALEFAKNAKNPHLVHIGAGVPSLGEVKDDVLAKLIPDEVRYIGVGVGKKWNRAFMKMTADRTGGYFTQINPDEPVAWRAFDLLATLNTPRLLDVRVVDPSEKINYLTDAVTLAQGEEICAFARGASDKFELPTKVLITGRLDGKPYQREITIPGGLGNRPHEAGYLPRTWAKLEIDRLLADGQDKNKTAITELSKAMYVMSPFTSLLVLETEADYQRFHVDRGRKDHWAMYGCPERIPQVYEPDPLYQHYWWHIAQPQDGQKPSTEQVLDTILMRLPPHYVYANGRQINLPHVATARQVFLSGYAVAEELLALGDLGVDDLEVKFSTWSLRAKDLPMSDILNESLLLRRSGLRKGGESRWESERLDFGFRGRDGRSRPMAREPVSRFLLQLRDEAPQSRLGLGGNLQGIDVFGRPNLGRLFDRLSDFDAVEFDWGGMDDSRSKRLLFEMGGRAGKPMAFGGSMAAGGLMAAGGMPMLRQALSDLSPKARGLSLLVSDRKRAKGLELGEELAGLSPVASFELMMRSLDGGEWTPSTRKTLADLWIAQLAEQLRTRQSVSWLAYNRPQHQLDQRLFADLTLHAPGLSTSWADIQNTLALEAKQERPMAAGKIDDAARALFDKARQAGWSAVAYPGVGRIPGFKVVANGQGQFSYERTLSSGLVEQVVCDGKSLWHLYPEIGLGTRRPFSRFHFGELAVWAPWALPRIEDLASGADLVAVNDNTVALIPHAMPTSRPSTSTPPTKEEKKESAGQMRFVFAADGALAEIQIVEMPAAKILVRQTFDERGTIRLIDGEGKQLAERKLDRQAAAAPELLRSLTLPARNSPLDELVILDMPLRTTSYWDRRLDALRLDAAVKDDESLLNAPRLALFASSCFIRDRDSLPMFAAYHHAKGDKRLGFYTLLSLRDTHFLQQPNKWAPGIATFDPVQEHPESPLARYLAHHQKNMNPQYNADSSFLENVPGPKDRFIARMASFRNAWNAWRMGHLITGGADNREREKRKLMDFIPINTSPLIAFVLQSNLNHMNSEDRAAVSTLIYESQKDYVDPLGMGYVFAYDAAYHLYYKGDRKQASRIFREQYATALKEGVLPKIDDTFRRVLDDTNSGGPNFGEFMRGTVQDFLKKDQPHFALLAALQASQIGGQSLGDEVFQHIMQHLPKNADRLVYLAALEYLIVNRLQGRPDALDGRADELRDRLLADKDVAAKSGIWRLSAALAQERGQAARSVADLEKALDIEYQQMPDMINLEAVRTDYRLLFSRYWEIAKAAQTLEQTAPAGLVDRVVRTADRWRSLDSQAGEICQRTGAILKMLGAKDLAWDYQTTPIALRPNEAAPWLELAQQLRESGDLEQADDAYGRAFQSESTNPQILWDRAQNLLKLGRVTDARQLWREIAEGTWQERFQALIPQARWHLEHN